jgi:cytochrome c oxidase subunit IV
MKSVESETVAMAHDGDVHAAPPPRTEAAHGQQHPIALYLTVWGLLFVLSACSYLVDYFNFQGLERWGLIVLFMLAKAGLIVAVFMHMAWERLALVVAILLPPMAVLVFVGTMAFEGDYTHFTRAMFFVSDGQQRIEAH